jgi:hypothetical protein
MADIPLINLGKLKLQEGTNIAAVAATPEKSLLYFQRNDGEIFEAVYSNERWGPPKSTKLTTATENTPLAAISWDGGKQVSISWRGLLFGLYISVGLGADFWPRIAHRSACTISTKITISVNGVIRKAISHNGMLESLLAMKLCQRPPPLQQFTGLDKGEIQTSSEYTSKVSKH